MKTPSVLLYDCPASICCQMARLTLAEKGVAFARQNVDIMDRVEQFEPWYTAATWKGRTESALHPRAGEGARLR